MRVLMVSKALVVGMYQRKLEEMAALPGVELTVAVPPYWRDKGHDWRLERSFTKGYTLVELPIRFNGHYHVHFYPGLAHLIDKIRPEILHFDEEAFNLSTWLALRAARRRGARFAFFNWQNIARPNPPPFRWMEGQVLNAADLAIVGNQDAATIIRAKGYQGPMAVIPQFGIDPELFAPLRDDMDADDRRDAFTIGFVGRMIEAKGFRVLLDAAARLGGNWQITAIGSGPDRDAFAAHARAIGIADRVTFPGQVASLKMPDVMRGFDVLVGPSLTTPRWKEQFGRMLVEAMACGIPVIGSDSGEIPSVIGDAGIIVPEGNVVALHSALNRLRSDIQARKHFGMIGRRRVLEQFTQAAIAKQTVAAYHSILN
jgi:glycosyltransferase involved in cell wall biosynthesis